MVYRNVNWKYYKPTTQVEQDKRDKINQKLNQITYYLCTFIIGIICGYAWCYNAIS